MNMAARRKGIDKVGIPGYWDEQTTKELLYIYTSPSQSRTPDFSIESVGLHVIVRSAVNSMLENGTV